MPSDADTGLAPWSAAIAARLRFFLRGPPGPEGARLALAAALAGLRQRTAEPGGDAAARDRFLRACLALLMDTARMRPALLAVADELEALCDLARAALDGEPDDRPVNARAEALADRPGIAGWAARVPGRVVWLAAMARDLPEEVPPAAVRLVNDLAAVGADLPLRALQAAARA